MAQTPCWAMSMMSNCSGVIPYNPRLRLRVIRFRASGLLARHRLERVFWQGMQLLCRLPVVLLAK